MPKILTNPQVLALDVMVLAQQANKRAIPSDRTRANDDDGEFRVVRRVAENLLGMGYANFESFPYGYHATEEGRIARGKAKLTSELKAVLVQIALGQVVETTKLAVLREYGLAEPRDEKGMRDNFTYARLTGAGKIPRRGV